MPMPAIRSSSPGSARARVVALAGFLGLAGCRAVLGLEEPIERVEGVGGAGGSTSAASPTSSDGSSVASGSGGGGASGSVASGHVSVSASSSGAGATVLCGHDGPGSECAGACCSDTSNAAPPKCFADPTKDCGTNFVTASCDEPNDCAPDEECCVEVLAGKGTRHVSCKKKDGFAKCYATACKVPADCPEKLTCTPNQKTFLFTLPFGLCL